MNEKQKRACFAKVRHETKEAAIATIHKRWRKEVLGVYQCPVCSGWHLTRRADDTGIKSSYKQPINFTGRKMNSNANGIYRNTFRPTIYEIQKQRLELTRMHGEDHPEIDSMLQNWIDSETDYRMEEGAYDNWIPKFQKRKVTKPGKGVEQ